MKTINYIFILLILSGGLLYGQANNLQVNFTQNNQTGSTEFSVNLNISTDIQSGFYLEWPDGMKAVLKSVKVGEQTFWLKEETGTPDRNNVVYWQSDDKGILLSFQQGSLNSGDLVTLDLMPHNVSAISDSANVLLKNISTQNDQQKTPNQTIMSQNINKPVSE